MNQKFKSLALWIIPVVILMLVTWQIFTSGNSNSIQQTNNSAAISRNTAVSRMSYGRFIDYIDSGRVTAVDIYEGGRNAVVEAVDPELDNRVQKIRVDLPGLAPELINKLKEEGISFL